MTLTDFLLPLALTLAFEGVVALVWGLWRWDLLLFVLVNVLTNPVAVLLHALFSGWAVTAVLELGVMAVEGLCYDRLGYAVRYPWLFSLAANVFSFCLGLVVDILI